MEDEYFSIEMNIRGIRLIHEGLCVRLLHEMVGGRS